MSSKITDILVRCTMYILCILQCHCVQSICDVLVLPAGGSNRHGDQEPRTEQSGGGAQQAG